MFCILYFIFCILNFMYYILNIKYYILYIIYYILDITYYILSLLFLLLYDYCSFLLRRWCPPAAADDLGSRFGPWLCSDLCRRAGGCRGQAARFS